MKGVVVDAMVEPRTEVVMMSPIVFIERPFRKRSAATADRRMPSSVFPGAQCILVLGWEANRTWLRVVAGRTRTHTLTLDHRIFSFKFFGRDNWVGRDPWREGEGKVPRASSTSSRAAKPKIQRGCLAGDAATLEGSKVL